MARSNRRGQHANRVVRFEPGICFALPFHRCKAFTTASSRSH